jgi:hypothetical protein
MLGLVWRTSINYQLKINFVLAMISTAPNARLTISFENCLMPNLVPISAPTITAIANSHNASGNSDTDEMCPSNPKTEFVRINNAAVPEAPLTDVQAKNMISGERKMPPPVPVNPESKPITAPVSTEIATGGCFGSLVS